MAPKRGARRGEESVSTRLSGDFPGKPPLSEAAPVVKARPAIRLLAQRRFATPEAEDSLN